MANLESLSDHVVSVYRTQDQAEGAIRFLGNAGHDIKNLSLIGQDFLDEADKMQPGGPRNEKADTDRSGPKDVLGIYSVDRQ